MEISLDAPSLDLGPEDPAALQAIILAQHQKILGMEAANRALEALIQALKLTIARLKRQKYGASSEKIDREIAQLELALESLEMAGAAADATPESGEPADDAATDATATEQRLPPRRRGKPRISADAPREVITLDPGERCPDCGGALRLVGEDVAEILDRRQAQGDRDPPAEEVLPRLRAHGPAPGPIKGQGAFDPISEGDRASRPWRPARSRAAWPGRRYWRTSW